MKLKVLILNFYMKKKVFVVCKFKHDQIDDYSAAVIYWYGILDKMGYEVHYENYSNYNPDEFYSKIKNSLNWTPKTDFNEGLDKTINYYLNKFAKHLEHH